MAFIDVHIRLLSVLSGRNHLDPPSEEITLETLDFMRRNFPSIGFGLTSNDEIEVPPNVDIRRLNRWALLTSESSEFPSEELLRHEAAPAESERLTARQHVAALLQIAARRLERR